MFLFQNNLERNEVETKQRLGKQIEALERDKVSLQKRLDAGERQQNVANIQWEVSLLYNKWYSKSLPTSVIC